MSSSAIVDKLNDLYVINRWKYLILPKFGDYKTITYYKNQVKDGNENEKAKSKPLVDWDIIQHLKGNYTIGVFAGKPKGIESSKFMTFDIDIIDLKIAGWYAHKIGNALLNHNDTNKFYVSYSGRKGYHIDLFFDAPIPIVTLQRFFKVICAEAECNNIGDGQVEFRPTISQGVKLPLGFNYKNKDSPDNYCYFAEYNSLQPIQDPNYILTIKKIDNIEFQLMVDELCDNELQEAIEKQKSDYQYIKENYKPLPSYKENIDEDYTVEAIQELEATGLKHIGMRHNSLMKLCKLYKHYGLLETDNSEMLIEWMKQQPKQYYSTKWDDVVKDINLIVDYVYQKDCNIVIVGKDISVSYAEMKQIMKAGGKNEKLLLFAMLVHSKRYATKTGVFYFPYSSIMKTTGLADKTITKYLNSLDNNGFIEITQRNEDITVNGKWVYKKANKYKVLILPDEILPDSYTVNKDDDNYRDAFNDCILTYFSSKEIKDYCGRRHFEKITKDKYSP